MKVAEATEEVQKEGENPENAGTIIWTVGHSTRSSQEFNEILIAHGIEALADVRSFPSSRRYPHFNKPELSHTLEGIEIIYLHIGSKRS